jgi:hypothetical protein
MSDLTACLSTIELAKRLGVSRQWCRTMAVKRGIQPAHIIKGKQYWFPDDISRFDPDPARVPTQPPRPRPPVQYFFAHGMLQKVKPQPPEDTW